MRIAISGAHFSGKTKLIKALVKELSHYRSVEESYYLLNEEGYEFSNPPTVEDFEAQLNYSIKAIENSEDNTLFDRCPLDFLSYALTIQDNEELDTEDWIQRMKGAIEKLDLIVFVPIEKRIPAPKSEDLEWRANVDEQLYEMVMNDSLGILENVEVLEVTGSVEKRMSLIKEKLKV